MPHVFSFFLNFIHQNKDSERAPSHAAAAHVHLICTVKDRDGKPGGGGRHEREHSETGSSSSPHTP